MLLNIEEAKISKNFSLLKTCIIFLLSVVVICVLARYISNDDFRSYINRNIFYTDEYCLIEYKPCIELFDYVLEKCNILHMTKTEFKFFEKKDREGIMKKLVDLEIENLMSIE